MEGPSQKTWTIKLTGEDRSWLTSVVQDESRMLAQRKRAHVLLLLDENGPARNANEIAKRIDFTTTYINALGLTASRDGIHAVVVARKSGTPKKLDNDSVQQLAQRYQQGDMTLRELAKEQENVSHETIRKAIKDAGYATGRHTRRLIDEDTATEIADRYRKGDVSLRGLANEYEVSEHTIRNAIKRASNSQQRDQ